MLHRWRKEFRQGPGNAFPGLGKRRWEETGVAQLERKIGQQALEIDFLKWCLQHIDEQRKLQALTGKPLSTSPRSAATGSGHGLAGCDPADRAGIPQLRLATDGGGTQTAWLGRES